MDHVQHVIFNMCVIKDLDNKLFDYIYHWGNTLTDIAWDIRASYHRTIGTTSAQYIFGRDMTLKLTSVLD